jgi:hypothetical protein
MAHNPVNHPLRPIYRAIGLADQYSKVAPPEQTGVPRQVRQEQARQAESV